MPFLLNETMTVRFSTRHSFNAAATRFVGEINRQKCTSQNLYSLRQLRFSSSAIRTKAALPSAITNDVSSEPGLPPLSRMPTGMFLRSLLISTISSKRLLLLPALSILTFISKPNRGFLFNADKNPILHAILKKTFYEQFCAGENEAETKRAMQRIKDLGFRGVILTYARETVFDAKTNTGYGQGLDDMNITTAGKEQAAKSSEAKFDANIDAWTKGSLASIDLLGDDDYLALKYVDPSHSISTPQSMITNLNFQQALGGGSQRKRGFYSRRTSSSADVRWSRSDLHSVQRKKHPNSDGCGVPTFPERHRSCYA